MNDTTDPRSALRDFFQFHFGSHAWLPALLVAVALGALAFLLAAILTVRPGPGWIPPEFRQGIAFRAIICWAISTLCAYAGGFIMGRLYVPRA
jgi:hypothetical protein